MIRHAFLYAGANAPPVVTRIDLDDLTLFARGKVREIYDLGEHLLIAASDRLSAFDVVLNESIPGKGIVLSTMSAFWFQKTAAAVPNHYSSDDPSEWPAAARRHADLLRGRAMLVRKCRRINVECVVRGYLAGAGWAEYQRTRSLGGVSRAMGLLEADRLDAPVFTPTTKAETGHDEPLTRLQMVEMIGSDLTDELESRSLNLYALAERYARSRGIILADTKFEFGLLGDAVLQIDESLTPDSSRFWPADQYKPGRTPPSFDKQPVRDYLEATGWDRRPPPPPLPPHVVRETSERYREAFLRLVEVQV